MKCSELIEKLNILAPQEYQCDWDNLGLQVGSRDTEIHRALVALDVTNQVVEQAVAENVDFLLTHHPLIFKPLNRVDEEYFIARHIVKMIRAKMCYFVMHTDFDVAPGCMADLAAERLGMKAEEPLETTGEVQGVPIGIGKVGTLPAPMTVEELAHKVRDAFGLPFVTVYDQGLSGDPVTRIAVLPGSGGSMVSRAVSKGAQALVTGDIRHHDGINAVSCGMAVIDAGHYGLEHIFISFMADYIRKVSGGGIEVIEAKSTFPVRVV